MNLKNYKWFVRAGDQAVCKARSRAQVAELISGKVLCAISGLDFLP